MNTRMSVSGSGVMVSPGALGIGLVLEGDQVIGILRIRGSQ